VVVIGLLVTELTIFCGPGVEPATVPCRNGPRAPNWTTATIPPRATNPLMNCLLETSSFDSGFFVGVAGRPALGEETTGRETAGEGVPTLGAGREPTGVPMAGLEPTGVPIVGLGVAAPTTGGLGAVELAGADGCRETGFPTGVPIGVPILGLATGVPDG